MKRLFRLLMAAWPRATRARFGEAMEYAFAREYEAARAKGVGARVALLLRTTTSMVWNGIAERLALRRGARVGGSGFATGSLLDVRHAVRRLSRRPGFAIATVVTLSLGIGSTTAMFSLVNTVLLRPPDYPRSKELVVVGHRSATDILGIPAVAYHRYRERSRSLVELAVYIESSTSASGYGEPVELGLIQATPSLLHVLGITPVFGRDLTDADAAPGASPVGLISYAYWQTRLGGDPDVIGKPVVEGSAPLVAGVLPRDFAFERAEASVVFGNPFGPPDIILPLRVPDTGVSFGNFMYQGIGRLAPGVTPVQAQAELQALMLETAAAYPGGFTPADLEEGAYRPRVERLHEAVAGEISSVLWILLGAVGVLLAIAMANVANLFLVRAETQRVELAIRRALGATRGAIIRGTLIESLILTTCGGVFGALLAAAGIRPLLRLAPTDIPRAGQLEMDPPVLLFVIGLVLLCALVFGLAPHIRTGASLAGANVEHNRGGTAGGRATRTRTALVITQIAFALVLLVGSVLLLRTFANLRRVDPGFDGSHTVTLRLALSGPILRSSGFTQAAADAARTQFMLSLVRELETVPGVERAAFTADLPLDDGEFRDAVAIEGAFPSGLGTDIKALRVFMGPGYLEAIGAHMMQGREFDAADFADQPRVVVVNRSFAEKRWPGESPLGRRITQYWPGLDPSRDIWYTVIGVVDDIRESSLIRPAEETVYLPTVFLPDGDFAMFVSNMAAVVKVSGDPRAALPRIREAVRAWNAEVPINSEATMPQLTAASFRAVSFAMIVVILAAILSLAVGVVGIYGTVAWVVSQRTREFGLRMALGASRGRVRTEVMASSGRTAVVGLAIGGITAVALSGVIRSLLYGVAARDPLIYAAVAACLFAVVMIASLGPAERAASADPASSMRMD